MAETLMDPDEIWLGVARKNDPVTGTLTDLVLDRRYIRASPDASFVGVLEVGRRWWEDVTIYPPERDGKPSLGTLHQRRGGKLLWKRK